eukprot:gene1883-3651_t
MNSSSKRRKRSGTQVKEEVELEFELESTDKIDFFRCLRDLYVKRALCDIVFKVNDNRQFEAHRVVLAASNNYFGALINSGMQESDSRLIHIKEDGDLFKTCLDFLYGLPIRIESSQVIPLLGLANSYSMINLRDQLADRLEANLTVENCCAIYAAAEHALSKVFNNFALASKTPAFSATRWLETMIVADETAKRTTDRVLDGDGRGAEGVLGVLDVLRAVRYPLMDAGYLSDVIKGHHMMRTPERANLLMEAFEHHALRAAGRPGAETSRTRQRKQSCSFLQSTLLNGHQDSGSWDTSIKVWDTNSWQCTRTLSDHTDSIRGLCVCLDKVVSCSDDGSIKVWTPGSWTCVRSLAGHEGACNAVVLCGARLASAGDDGVINLWNTSNWACEVTVHHGAAEAETETEDNSTNGNGASSTVGVMSLEVVGQGVHMRLVSGSDDAAIKIWNTSSWTCERVLRAHQDEIWALRSTGDSTLVTGSVDGTLRSWRYHPRPEGQDIGGGDMGDEGAYSEWECESVVSSSSGPVYAAICLEGRVVSAGAGNRIAVWGSDWKLHRWFDTEEAGVWALAVCKGRLVSGGVDGTLRVWM